MKKVAILQSNYIPWKGYFDMINMVDEFILFDTAQYTKNDWRNRNKILTPQGLQWLSLPIRHSSVDQRIEETLITDEKWNVKHWRTISQAYAKAPFFKLYRSAFEDFYLGCKCMNLSRVNYSLIMIVNDILGIGTRIRWSNEFDLPNGQTEKLLSICKQANATSYLSGPAAKNYFDEGLAAEHGIAVEWMSYSGYPEYPQLHAPFEHGVTVLDLIFNEGPNATKFMKSFL